MLKNDRIELKLIEEEDLNYIVRWRNAAYDSFYEFPISNSGQKLWFDGYMKSNDLIFIIHEFSGKKIGMLSLSSFDQRNKSAEFGRFLIDSNYRGKRYGKTALILLLEYAFNHLNLNRIYLDTFEYNTEVINLYKSLGFVIEGKKFQAIYKDGDYINLVCMCILKDWYKGEVK